MGTPTLWHSVPLRISVAMGAHLKQQAPQAALEGRGEARRGAQAELQHLRGRRGVEKRKKKKRVFRERLTRGLIFSSIMIRRYHIRHLNSIRQCVPYAP